MAGNNSPLRPRLATVAFVTAVLVSLALTACGSSSKTTSPSSSSPAVTSTTSTTTPTRTAYGIYLIKNEKLVVAGRESDVPPTPEVAVRTLMAGPQGSLERDLGMSTSIPAGTVVHSVSVANGLATIDMSRSFESGGGSQSMQARAAQVVFTATQFPEVQRVSFKLDGAPVTSIGGEGVMVDKVTRADFTNVTPAILVESPTPGEQVSSPLRARGIANTFEATVNYTLTDPDGVVLVESHTTATAGSGTWGDFSMSVPYKVTRSGMGSLIVYQISARDGSRTDIMEVPIQLER